MKGRQIFEIALGIITSVGGFLEVGSIATSAQAGANFGMQLIWPIVLGTILIIFMIEMSGRLAAVSGHPLPAAVRQRFGFKFFVFPLMAETLVDFLVLTSEIGGCALALELMTGISFRWFALPIALLAWVLLWRGSFGVIEYGVSLLGLITLVFAVAAWKTHPLMGHVFRSVLPSLPKDHKANYWFLVVSILGATVSPFLFNFYSSGAVEDKWDEKDLTPNRITATLGMGFGGMNSIAVLIAAAMTLLPRKIPAEHTEQIAKIVSIPLGQAGFWIFGAALFIACFGAAVEVGMDIGYVWSQGFGWSWGENKRPAKAARFHATSSLLIFAAVLPLALGADPLKLTLFSMAITTVILPLVVLPFLVLMNDEQFVGKHRNGWISNSVVYFVIVMASILAVIAIPLEIAGGS